MEKLSGNETQKRKFCFWSAYILIMLLVFVVSLELVSRHLFVQYELSKKPSEMVYDSKLGWRAKKNYSGKTHHGNYPVSITVHTNADGFRDGDWDEKLMRAEISGAQKILFIGDSYLYGWASAPDERVTEQLSALYHYGGKPIEVFNSGIPGYGTSQEYRLLPELLERLQPGVVVLIFTENDYGDTALPYNHRYPYRVYKPFYDLNGELVFNMKIPKRPSLKVKDTVFGRFYLWYAIDSLYYFIQDMRYKAYDIPNSRNSSYPIGWYDWFIYREEVKARFPYVEQTVMTLFSKMNQIVEAVNARFLIVSSLKRAEYVIADQIRQRGIAFVPTPPEQKHFLRWEPALYDGHPNFLWSWFIANKIYEVLEGKPYALDWSKLPQLHRVPSEIDLSDDVSARFLFGSWFPSKQNGRWMGRDGAFLLRSPRPEASAALLEVFASADREQVVDIVDDMDSILCTFHFSPATDKQTCQIVVRDRAGLLFLQAVPRQHRTSIENVQRLENQKKRKKKKVPPLKDQKKTVLFKQIAIR